MSMQSSWHTWDPGLVYFLWFSFVLSLLGNVSFPIMGANTLFLLRNVCILDWSKITMHWLCLRHNYYARISKAAFRTADRGRDSCSCERLCTSFKQKKGVPTHTHVLSFSQQPLPPQGVFVFMSTTVSSVCLLLVLRGPLIRTPPFTGQSLHMLMFSPHRFRWLKWITALYRLSLYYPVHWIDMTYVFQCFRCWYNNALPILPIVV